MRRNLERAPSRFMARATLESLTVTDLASFRSLISTERADLVVLDTESADLPVAEACRALRADARTAAIPVLVLAPEKDLTDSLRDLGVQEVVARDADPNLLQDRIAAALGIRLRRHPRFPVVLPVARGRIFHEFLGYSNSISESGMGFDTIARIRGGDQLNLKIYRSTEERPIAVTGRVCGVRANIDTGIGYAVGVEFSRLASADKQRLIELFPAEGCVTWGSDGPGPPGETAVRA